ncbi:MAG TPA: type II toxin-antitoxin system RelE/ParE family toxin [Solirubrobacteraceae bacterium]|jgi:mRNA-degrading endonuclease RelE of RelBE toxin-antitoxin system|nr:type II toxin-antitoxin system RelE/ParE family toxin [Solirubrobacteraceae bacterium]
MMAPARRQLDRLPVSVAAAVLEALEAIASNPRRLGKPLRFELEGCWSARRGPYRVVYRIDDEARVVSVLAIAHRADVYRPR